MAMSSSAGGGVKAEPNVTPMIDVMLVLLIIFMVVTPALLAGFNAQPPQGQNLKDHPEDEETDQVLGIDRDPNDDLINRTIAKTAIEADIIRRRAALGHTVDTLRDRLTPAQLLRQGIAMIHDVTDDARDRIATTVTRHPIQLALIGIGLGWLIWSETREPAPEPATRQPDRPKDLETVIERHALAVGGLTIFAGALLAWLLPPSKPEDDVLGETSDVLRDAVAATGRETLDAIEDIAIRTVEAALAAASDTARAELDRVARP